MPVVPAASLPYTGVPELSPTVGTPNAYQNIPSTAEDFGAFRGQQLSRIGSSLLESGRELAGTAIAIQEQANIVAANKATSDYQDAETKILYGDPNNPNDTGFFGKKGEEAVRAAPLVRQQLLQLRNQIGASLQNPRQQVDFDGQTRHLQAQTLRAMGQHYVRESLEFHTETLKARATNAQDRVNADILRGDDAGARAWVGERMRADLERLKVEGKDSPENRDLVMQQARSDYVVGTAQALANIGRPDQAITLINNNADALHGGAGEKLLQHYQGVMLQINAERAQRGEKPLGQGGSLAPGGGGDGSGGWGDYGPVAVQTMRARNVSPAMQQALIAAGLSEGGFKSEWQLNKQGSGAAGHWQLLPGGGELPAYERKYGQDRSTKNQTNFVLDRLEEIQKGITTDPNVTPQQALDFVNTRFEKYEGAGPGQRSEALKTAQRILGDQAHALEPGAKPDEQKPPGSRAANAPTKPDDSGNYRVSAWGDSIAAHSIRLGGVGGVEYNDRQKEDSTAISGANPSNIHNLLEHGPEQHIKGVDIVLSTGASNVSQPGPMNKANTDIIKDQIKTALERGAKTITVVGVGNAKFLEGRNAQLAQIVGEFKDPRVVFSGPINPKNLLPDGVHAKDKKAFVKEVLKTRDAGNPS